MDASWIYRVLKLVKNVHDSVRWTLLALRIFFYLIAPECGLKFGPVKYITMHVVFRKRLSKLSKNSEASASEFLENLEKNESSLLMFLEQITLLERSPLIKVLMFCKKLISWEHSYCSLFHWYYMHSDI